MTQIKIIDSQPKTNRKLSIRGENRTKDVVEEAMKFGQLYFDGDRRFGYGGYRYDGRWKKVAKRICKLYKLQRNSKVLDVGCAKGFLVKDLRDLGINCFGIDISSYAIDNCHPDVKNYLLVGDVRNLPYPNSEFDLVLSINTIHNLVRNDVIKALQELKRVSKKNCFVQIDSYLTEDQKRKFEEWVLTAKYHDFPQGWQKLFLEADYSGDWDWTIFAET